MVADAQTHSEHFLSPISDVFTPQVWSSENGLPQNSIHQILQTHDGYLWIATEGGIARFNGVQFTVFNHENTAAFSSNDTCCLTEDRTGALWIGTADGVLRYAQGEFRRYTIADGLPSSLVVSLAPATDGSVLVLTSMGLTRHQDQKFTSIEILPSALGTGPDGHVWLATPAGAFSYNNEHISALPLANLPTEPIEGLGSLRNGLVWLRTRTSLLVWNRGVVRTWHSGRELPGTRVQSFLEDSRGNLWVGTDQGLVQLLSPSKSPLEIQPLIGATSVLALFEDREHNLWVGTDISGLHVLRRQKFRTLPQLSSRAITAITENSDGTVWVGTKEGLFRDKNNDLRQLTTKDGLISDVILSLAADPDGSLWIGTPDGLDHLQGEKIKSFTSADGLPDDLIRSLYCDTDGSLWVGTRHGLAHWKDQHFAIQSDDSLNGLIGAMLRSSSNDLWVATLNGLVRIRDGKLNLYTKGQGLSGDVITSLLEDANHSLWVGTRENGLSRSVSDGFSAIRAQDVPHEIDSILEDRRGYLWLASSRGITRVLASELAACGKESLCTPHVASYGSSDGMPSEEMSSSGHPSAWKMTDGRLWFATRKGVAIADPNDIVINSTRPPVVVERFTVDDVEWKATGSELTIPPGHVRYAFEYAALNFVSPLRARYRYILEGFDKDWTSVGSRRNAYYTNLPPRHYRFRVQAANEDGIWNETGAELSFVIKPPFYRTFWFSGLAILLLVAVIFSIYKLRVRALRSQFDAILKERNRIAREIHDTLAQGFVGISVQLELTSHLLNQSHVIEASQQVDRTRALVREGLDDARRTIWDLRNTGTQASLPARLTQLVEQNSTPNLKADIRIGGTYRALAPSLENEVFRISQEAFVNIARHSRATHASLELRYDPNQLTLTVTDNGIGFTADSTLSARGHFGLQGMRERSDQIGGKLTIESSLEIGSTITLQVPLRH
ncbi:MAG TPA: two-component regulator propeller domain-containing protein [Edaphobacter sp.]|nr:two-component regulator propeller domain-containing protein [Edaphobacter sp.]